MTNSPVKLWEDPGQIATQIIFAFLKGAGVSLNWFELMENRYSRHKAQTNLVLLDFTGSGVSASMSETSALFSSSSAMVLVVLLTTSSWLSLPSITSASI